MITQYLLWQLLNIDFKIMISFNMVYYDSQFARLLDCFLNSLSREMVMRTGRQCRMVSHRWAFSFIISGLQE